MREAFAEKTGLFRKVFARADDASPDCSGTDETFEVLRALTFLTRAWRQGPQHAGPRRPECPRQRRRGAALHGRGRSAGDGDADAIYHRWQSFFSRYDVILTPAITVSPRSWRELYPAEIDGKPTRTYFHWLAMAYAVTVRRASGPFAAGRVGQQRHALRPADRRAARRRRAGAAGRGGTGIPAWPATPRTARPVPDLAALRKAPPISAAEGFLGFD